MPKAYMSGFAGDARPVPATELLAWRGRDDESNPGRFHAWSWLLYHFLWNKHGKAFSDYQKRLSDGEEPAAAWRGALPQFDPAQPAMVAALDRALDEYRRSARYAFYTVKAEAAPKYSEIPLASADVHIIHLAAGAAWPDPDAAEAELLRTELNEALEEDPGHAGALAWRMEVDKKFDLERLRKALSGRPRDWLGWNALGRWLLPGKEKEEAFRKAASLNSENAMAQNNLAWMLAMSARPREALPFANKALDLAPWNPDHMNTLARVAAGLGRCPEALKLAHRAFATAQWEGTRIDEYKKAVAGIEAACGVGPR